MMFKYSLGIVPKPKSLLFTRNNEIHHHNTRHSSLLHPMIGRTEATYKTFGSQAILIWKYTHTNIYKRNHNLFQENIFKILHCRSHTNKMCLFHIEL